MSVLNSDMGDDFYKQVQGFLVCVFDARAKAVEAGLRQTRVELSYRTAAYPSIVQQMLHEESCDALLEGVALVEKLDRLTNAFSGMDVVPFAYADMATRKLDKISLRIDELKAKYPEEGVQDILFFEKDESDYRAEVAELPFSLCRQFLLAMPPDPGRVIEKVSVSWRRPDEKAVQSALKAYAFKTVAPLPQNPAP